MKLADHCALILASRAERDPAIWVLDGDLADSDGALHFAERHPDRFLMAGIAEQSMVSMAAGMASCGARPWVFSFAAFLCYRSYDQVRVSVSQSQQPVTLVGSHSGGCAARNGKTHSALNDLAAMLSLAHVQVWAPADKADVEHCVDSVLSSRQPAYIRLPRRPMPDLPGPCGPVRIFGEISATVVVATGLGTLFALEAREVLRETGIEVAVIHVPGLRPFPEREIRRALAGVRRVVTVEDHVVHGGLGTLIYQLDLGVSIDVVGWPVDWAGESGSDDDLRSAHGLDARALAERIAARRVCA